MNKNIGLAFGIGAVFLLFAGARRASSGPPPPPRSGLPPLPGNVQPPGVPPDPDYPYPDTRPRPRAPSSEVKLVSLHRYEFVADVLPVAGVDLEDFAKKAMVEFGLSDPDFDSAKPAERDGWSVTRVKFKANVVTGRTIALNAFYSIQGAGTIWVVSVKDITKF